MPLSSKTEQPPIGHNQLTFTLLLPVHHASRTTSGCNRCGFARSSSIRPTIPLRTPAHLKPATPSSVLLVRVGVRAFSIRALVLGYNGAVLLITLQQHFQSGPNHTGVAKGARAAERKCVSNQCLITVSVAAGARAAASLQHTGHQRLQGHHYASDSPVRCGRRMCSYICTRYAPSTCPLCLAH